MKKAILVFLLAVITIAASSQTCKGIKKDGTACKIVVGVNKAGYCRYHDPAAEHCAFIKKDGTRCKMAVKKDVTRCRFHVGK